MADDPMFGGLSPEDQKLAHAVLDRQQQTALEGWDGKSAHPPGCDPGDQIELLKMIFGTAPWS